MEAMHEDPTSGLQQRGQGARASRPARRADGAERPGRL